MDKGDSDYMAMLNNPTINPGPKQQQEQHSISSSKSLDTATSFDTLTSACNNIKNVSKDLILVSESDEPFEWVSADWTKTDLPTAQEIINLGWVDQNASTLSSFKTKTLDQFFEPMMDETNDSYNQAKGFQSLYKTFKEAFNDKNGQVYFFGQGSITVLVLGIINASGGGRGRALAGLRSLLVQT
ncbi:hypothetical protein BDC45DRAFT_508944 [Circinella umbellata]|nr:hypothetical protein BDC45DRAFT_508944 [Circinella umbellata]